MEHSVQTAYALYQALPDRIRFNDEVETIEQIRSNLMMVASGMDEFSFKMIQRADDACVKALNNQRRTTRGYNYYQGWFRDHALIALGQVSANLTDRVVIEYALDYRHSCHHPENHLGEMASVVVLLEDQPLYLNVFQLGLVCVFLGSTVNHRPVPVYTGGQLSDHRYFLDIDTSIHAIDPELYDEYEAQVRLEHKHMGDREYAKSRAIKLNDLAGKKNLFHTEWGKDSFTSSALININRTISMLR